MPVTRWRKNPIEFEAIQFTGNNWAEMREFCGRREVDGHSITNFNPIGTYVSPFLMPKLCGELWVEANKHWLVIEPTEWVIRDLIGLYPCKDEIIRKNNTMIGEK